MIWKLSKWFKCCKTFVKFQYMLTKFPSVLGKFSWFDTWGILKTRIQVTIQVSIMMNLTKFPWPCYPTVGPKVVQGTTLMHANNWLQNDMDVARQSFPDHMSMVEWLLTWLTENRKASFLNFFFFIMYLQK